MNILYDHQTFSLQNYGGISRYFSELINGINGTTRHHAFLSVKYTNNTHARQLGLSDKSFLPAIDFPKKKPLLYRINKACSIADLLGAPFDLIHATYYDPYVLRFKKNQPIVVTFFDMIHERFSHRFAEFAADRTHPARKREMAEKATHIIAISEKTKLDIIEQFGTDPDKISVVHLGNSLRTIALPADPPLNAPSPYLLYVGNRDFYKNFVPFLRAIAPILHHYGLRLICAGGGKFSASERQQIQALRLTTTVSQCAITNDGLLQTLYSGATLVAFPSLYEGFGIPVLEAFACNCPCVISNQGALPEVAGDAAVYVDPYNADSMQAGIRQVLDSPALRQRLAERGQRQLTSFSWQSTVAKTVSIYQQL